MEYKLFYDNKIILDLCGGTGSWSLPYKKAGYDVRVITSPDYDVTDYIPPRNVYGILAAPPCTEFSPAKGILDRNFVDGMNTVNACIRIIFTSKPKFWALENPTGFLHQWLGPEKFKFEPWNYGDPWSKQTSLWGNFKIPKPLYTNWLYVPKNPNLYIRPGRKKPGIAFLHKSSTLECFPHLDKIAETDAEFRAITPQGFAKSFFEANQ